MVPRGYGPIRARAIARVDLLRMKTVVNVWVVGNTTTAIAMVMMVVKDSNLPNVHDRKNW